MLISRQPVKLYHKTFLIIRNFLWLQGKIGSLMIFVYRRAKTHKVINNLCAFGEYCIIPCIDTVLRPKLAQYRPKGEWVRGRCFKFAHGEWIYMCHINWFGYLCEYTFILIPFTTLEIISKNFKAS